MLDIANNLMTGFQLVFSVHVLSYAVLGCVVGTLVGILPGLGPLAGLSLLLPLTYGLEPTTAIVLLGAIYYGAMYGGSTTSILLRIPGEAASVVTCMDGYALARKGKAGTALAIAAIGSFIAGTLAVVALMLVAPQVARFALKFGPAEYVGLLSLGLVLLAYLSSGSKLRTLVMALAGLALGMVGIDPLSGYGRFMFNIPDLGDGIGIVPLAVGLFGISEVLMSASDKTTHVIKSPTLREMMPSKEEMKEMLPPCLRGAGIGFVIGIIPGSAHIISSFISYAVERRISKHPEQFGEGAIAGVSGPESANNAAASSAFVPMLALGLPAGAVPAVMLSALMMHGITPGPNLIQDRPELYWGFVASMYVGNLVLLMLNLPLVSLFVSVLRIPYTYLYPIILTFCIIGVYTTNSSVVDLWVMFGAGIAGYFLRRNGFDVAPLVLGFVLAAMFEMSLRQALTLSSGSLLIFVERPMAAVLLSITLSMVLYGAWGAWAGRNDKMREKMGL
jgi:putative tricarboxylic transport membrane protein